MKKTKRKMKLGILGAGGVTKDLHLPVLVNMDNIKMEWICDINEKRASQLAKLFKIPAVFNSIDKCTDVDIVLIAIPVGYRYEIMEKVIQRGWHIFCEKPFALTLKEFDHYLSEATNKDVQVGVGLVRRYAPATLMAQQFINDGVFGPIEQVWASEGAKTKRTGQDVNWYMGNPKVVGGGVLMETGTHLIDQLFTIIDAKDYKIDSCKQRIIDGLEFETNLSGSLSTNQYKDIKYAFNVSRLSDLCNGIFIQFSRFILKCGLFFQDPIELLDLKGNPIAQFKTNLGAKTIGQAFFLEWAEFIDQCISGNSSYVSADTSRITTAIIEDCYSSSDPNRS